MKKIVNWSIFFLIACLISGTAIFIHDSGRAYEISSRFESLPLQYNPDEGTSTYSMGNADITVYGGFVKGLQHEKDGSTSLVIRALSPLPTIEAKGVSGSLSIILENVDPDFYVKRLESHELPMNKLSANSLRIDIDSTEIKSQASIIKPDPVAKGESIKFVILGDNRDGYDTFESIIEQVNGLSPVFVIDNGDLVFSGKANQYRLFDNLTSQISSTFLTTLGNHDVRGDGRDTYTMLYGPPYYSFDFEDSHFAFVDSSPGWTELTTISDEQYAWLERDLQKAQGKRIFVITHIPPLDPREGTSINEIPNYVAQLDNGQSWIEEKLNNYSESKSMDHGFQDPEEAAKFEGLMSTYHVDTVYLSHIHSYLEYTINDVRYIITGGAGAEMLTTDSYHHYILADFANPDNLVMVQLPSPANNAVSRFAATAQIFADAMFRENRLAIILLGIGFALLLLLILLKIAIWKNRTLTNLGRWLRDVGRFAVKDFKNTFSDYS